MKNKLNTSLLKIGAILNKTNLFFFNQFFISKIRVVTAWFEICNRNNMKNLKKFLS